MGAVRRLGALGVALCLTACVSARSSGSDEAIRLYHEQMRLAGQPGANTASGDPGATAPLPSSLTADEAVALAKSRSAKLAALAAKADRATALVGLAGRPENPELQVGASPLGEAIARTVAGDLSTLLGTPRVASGPIANFAADYRVTLDVQRFDAKAGDGVDVDTVWVVKPANGAAARSGRTTTREPAGGAGYDALAGAFSRALAQLGDDLAAAIRAEAASRR